MVTIALLSAPLGVPRHLISRGYSNSNRDITLDLPDFIAGFICHYHWDKY